MYDIKLVYTSSTMFIWLLHRLHSLVLVNPLRTLYFNGPSLHGYGFWNGAQSTDICASLTGTSSLFWLSQLGECDTLLDRHFHAFLITVQMGVYILFLYNLCSLLWFRYCVLRPPIRALIPFHQPQIHKRRILYSPKKRTRQVIDDKET